MRLHPISPSRCPIAAVSLALGLVAVPAAPATITVTTLDDADAADGECSLREAITAANSDATHQECAAGDGRDVITFAEGLTGTITLAAAPPAFMRGADLVGPGAAALSIHGADLYPGIIIGSHASYPNQEYLISGLSLVHGFDATGGALHVAGGHRVTLREAALFDNSAGTGGAIYLSSAAGLATPTAVTLERCWLHGNEASSSGGAIFLTSGGELNITDSTLSENRTDGQAGAIRIANPSSPAPIVTISSSTLSGNSAAGSGGAISVEDTAMTLLDSTITDNTANSDADSTGGGGGIYLVRATLTLGNSVVAGNSNLSPASPAPDFGVTGAGVGVTSLGFNLVGSNQGATTVLQSGDPNPDGDAVGSAGGEIDPLLLALANNGGPIFTHLPEATSPAVDQGNCPGVLRDQRGFGNPDSYKRPVDDPLVTDAGDGCDKGAVERGAASIPADVIFRGDFEDGDTRYWEEVS